MALATINSVATTKTLRSNLRELPTYCSTIKGDIELLHSYFDTNYKQIIARGAMVDDRDTHPHPRGAHPIGNH